MDGFGGHRQISAQEAWDLAARTGADLVIEPNTLNTAFSYADAQNRHKKVWLLDAATAFNQVKFALANRPAGIAIWRLGLEDPGVWKVAGRGRSPDAAALSSLQWMEPGFGSFQDIRAALVGAGPPVTGKRELRYDRSMGLITGQTVSTYPRQASITAWAPADPKAIALTFDDGPDPKFTPAILDVLAAKGVKATFYLIGHQALAEPDLVKRIYEEGHDIGNHTFTHPDLNNATPARIAAELNLTTRLLGVQTGMRTVLFRPPYFMEGYSYFEKFPHLVMTASSLGYLLAGYDINPSDWIFSHADIEEIVTSDVIRGSGQVVLLHDGGGDRRTTLDALPGIIDKLQHAGFHFVTTHELVGLSKSEVMPVTTQENILEVIQAVVWRGATSLIRSLYSALPAIAISTAALGILRLSLICLCAYVQSRRRRSQPKLDSFKGTIAVVVPAYNEAAIIAKTVTALLRSNVNQMFEVIVVDDGSTDDTSRVVADLFAAEPRVKLLRKENGGKASALNFGLFHTNAEVVIAIDGDTLLGRDAISHLTRYFNDPSIGAVAGKVVVGNQVSLLSRFQALEYATSQNLDRRAFELFNAIGVVPGAIGAWRREAVLGVGGYSNDTLAEDADLTISLERSGWRVVSDHQAQAWTEAPETLRPFLKQRLRWMFGTLQVAYKHRGAIAKKPSGVSAITLPNVFLFQFGFTLLTPLMDAILLWCLGVSVLAALGITEFDGGTLFLIAAYWLVFQAADFLGAIVALAIDRDRRHWSLLPLLLLQRFTYRQLLYVTAIRALVSALKGVFVGWGKLARTGNVELIFNRPG